MGALHPYTMKLFRSTILYWKEHSYTRPRGSVLWCITSRETNVRKGPMKMSNLYWYLYRTLLCNIDIRRNKWLYVLQVHYFENKFKKKKKLVFKIFITWSRIAYLLPLTCLCYLLACYLLDLLRFSKSHYGSFQPPFHPR